MQGINLPNNTYAHITGVDMVRNNDGQYYVLEDNLRTPSGVSYMLENRKMMMRLYPEMFEQHHIAPVERYPSYLLQTLRESSLVDDPCVVVMTPGRFNSAYFEHSFLAQQMGSSWWRAPICLLKTARCICAPPRAAAGGCDLSPHRRRLARPAGLPRRFDARRPGAAVRLSRRRRSAGQRHRHRGG